MWQMIPPSAQMVSTLAPKSCTVLFHCGCFFFFLELVLTFLVLVHTHKMSSKRRSLVSSLGGASFPIYTNDWLGLVATTAAHFKRVTLWPPPLSLCDVYIASEALQNTFNRLALNQKLKRGLTLTKFCLMQAWTWPQPGCQKLCWTILGPIFGLHVEFMPEMVPNKLQTHTHLYSYSCEDSHWYNTFPSPLI